MSEDLDGLKMLGMLNFAESQLGNGVRPAAHSLLVYLAVLCCMDLGCCELIWSQWTGERSAEGLRLDAVAQAAVRVGESLCLCP